MPAAKFLRVALSSRLRPLRLAPSLLLFTLGLFAFSGEPLPTSTQIRVCQIDACSEVVPIALAPQGICLIHYLEEAFTRVDAALTFCQSGGTPDSSTLDWLLLQGDFAVALLSKKDGVRSSDQRGRLLELLLCLANVRECLRQRAASNA